MFTGFFTDKNTITLPTLIQEFNVGWVPNDEDITSDGQRVILGKEIGGAAYVYVRNELGGWTLEGTLSNPGSEGNYAKRVAISGDGTVAAVANAYQDDDRGSPIIPNTGCVHIFRRSGSTWTYDETVWPNATMGQTNYYWGFHSVDLNDDGTVLMMGRAALNSIAVFRFGGSPASFEYETKFTTGYGPAGLSGDGNVIAIRKNGASGTSRVFVYEYSGSWSLQEETTMLQYVQTGIIEPALNYNGTVMSLHPEYGEVGFGSLYVWKYSGGSWAEDDNFARNSPADEFTRLVLSDDGTRLAAFDRASTNGNFQVFDESTSWSFTERVDVTSSYTDRPIGRMSGDGNFFVYKGRTYSYESTY